MLNIFGFVKKMLPSVSKSDAEVDMEISIQACATVMDVYTQLDAIYKNGKLNSKKANKLLGIFLQELQQAKPQTKYNTRGLCAVTLSLFKNVQVNGSRILSELEDIKSEVIVSQALSASKATILRAVSHYYFMTKYALDFANYLSIQEALHGGLELPRDAQLNKKQTDFIESNAWIYARLLAVYGSDPDKFLSRLSEIEAYQITKDSVDDATTVTSNKIDLFDNLPQNFIGSPLYTVGLIFVQWEADRHKELKDKKRLLELRCLHLRLLQEQGRGDASTEKEIEHLQRRCSDLDYKIFRIEQSVE